MTAPALLPLENCPFCGGEAEYKRYSCDRWERVECKSCGARTFEDRKAPYISIQRWNTRTPSPLVALDEKALADIRECISHYVVQTETKDVDKIMKLISSKLGAPARGEIDEGKLRLMLIPYLGPIIDRDDEIHLNTVAKAIAAAVNSREI